MASMYEHLCGDCVGRIELTFPYVFTRDAFTIDSSTPTLRLNLNERTIQFSHHSIGCIVTTEICFFEGFFPNYSWLQKKRETKVFLM
jgi:hypothetical protein